MTLGACPSCRGREFWCDELDRLIPAAEKLPPRLSITIGATPPNMSGSEIGKDALQKFVRNVIGK